MSTPNFERVVIELFHEGDTTVHVIDNFPDIECTYDGARHSRPLLGGPRSHLEVRQDKVHDVLAKLS